MINISGSVKKLAKGGFFHVLTGGVLTKLVAFISSIIVVRLLSQEDYATLAYVDNIYGYLYIFAGLGFASGILKFCIDSPEKNKAYLKYALKMGLFFQFAVSILTFLLFQFGVFPIAKVDTLGSVLFIYPCLYYVIGLLESALRANSQNREFAWVSLLQVVLLMLSVIPLATLFSLMGIAAARYLAATATIIVAWYLLKNFKNVASSRLSKQEKKTFVCFSITLLASNLFSMLLPLNESFLVNNMLGDAEIVAGYRVASLIPSQITFFTSAVMIYFTPIFARLNCSHKAWLLSRKAALLNCGIIAVVGIIGCALTPILISLFYGDQYLSFTNLSIVLWIANSINAIFRIVPLNIIPMLGFPRFNLAISVITCIVHFFVDAFFIFSLGVMGAAIASIVVYAISAIVYWLYLYRITHSNVVISG